MTAIDADALALSMAAPREVPILLGLFASCGSVATHLVRATLERSQRRAAGLPVEPLAPFAPVAALSPADGVILLGVVLAGALAVLTARPWRPPPQPTMWRRRVARVLALWAAFAALSIGVTARRSIAEWASVLVPCAILALPARTYARHHDGEAEWAPWVIGFAIVVMGLTRDPKYTWGLLVIALVTHGVALAQERRRASREAR